MKWRACWQSAASQGRGGPSRPRSRRVEGHVERAGPLIRLLPMEHDRLMASALRSVLVQGRVCPRLECHHRRGWLY